MKKTNYTFVILTILLIAVALFSQLTNAQSAVDLGTSGDYVILSKSGISTTGTTSIIGNMGVSPISSTAITGFGLIRDSSNQFSTSSLVNGKIYAADYSQPTHSILISAINDVEKAYNDAAGRTNTSATEMNNGNMGEIGGLGLYTPGLYSWNTSVTISKDFVFNCLGNTDAVFILQIAGDLDIRSGNKIILLEGCQDKNIFWQVAGQTTLGTNSVFNGNILDKTAIVMNKGAKLNGRALAQTAVTLDSNTISIPSVIVKPLPILTTIKIFLSSLGNGVVLTSANLTSGSTLQLNATAFNQFDTPIAKQIIYVSSNPSIAKVNRTTGLVTAIFPGKAIITAFSGVVESSVLTEVITTQTSPIVNTSIPINTEILSLVRSSGGSRKSNNLCLTNWICSDWSGCSDNSQKRTCTESSSCSFRSESPILMRECNSIKDNSTKISLINKDFKFKTSIFYGMTFWNWIILLLIAAEISLILILIINTKED